jgi:branched-chain amino acid transport system permease protein
MGVARSEALPAAAQVGLARSPVLWIVAALLLAAPPLVTANAYYISLATDVLITAILTLSLNLVVGKSGQFAVSHAAFFGVGAYVAGLLSAKLGISGWLLLPLSVVTVAVLAVVVGIPVLRLSGYYLAVATLAFGKFCEVFVRQATPLTGGPYGLQDIPALRLFGVPVVGPLYYLLVAFVFFVCLLMLRNLSTAQLGRAVIAVRDDPVAAEATGIDIARTKLFAFVFAASLAGLAGWLQAYYRLQLDPSLLGLDLTFLWLFMVLVGGLGHYVGVFIGTVLLIVVPELLGFASDRTILLVGGLMIVVALFAPEGIGGWLDRAANLLRRRIRP